MLAVALAAALGSPAAFAQGSGSGWLSPGQWEYWRSSSERAPSGAPAMSICLSARGVRDVAVLLGEAPGDGSCKVRTPRRMDPQTLAADVECPDGRRLRALVRFSGQERFVTRLETVEGRPVDTNPSFVHGQRAGACP
ncbi:MAG: hypothetical protein RI988_215 [Pseudomonadota bacterium]